MSADNHYQEMSSQFYTEYVPRSLIACLESVKWSSFADLGCGEGVILNALNSMGYLSGKSIFAVDDSSDRLDRVSEICGDFKCIATDVCDTRIESGSIDLVVSTQVIEHVSDDNELVKEIYRILAPGGTAYVDTIFKKWYGWYFYRCNGKWTIDPTHVREYTADEQLIGLFLKNGLDIQSTNKILRRTPLLDAVLRRLGADRNAYKNRMLSFLRRITLPIPGYYIWEVVCRKPST